ncbi:hypothetical protein BGZ74_010976 [Mortierella antarctica]|nr:hypothetical protein BGZ74_010976 [Mortierella antarctica]
MDPHHDIAWKLIGNGVKSTTSEPGQFVTRSSLPIYNVYHSETGVHIVFDMMCQQCDNIYDYQDVLNHKKTAMKFVPQDSGTSLEEEFDICFLDTPGINDTNNKDVEHSKRVIEAIVQIQSFNLIIINVDSRFSISKEQQVAFSYYSRVIQELQGHHDNVVFTSKRPVRQGMIQDALKAILQKAVSTHPTALDTNEENIERVFAIKHPDEVNHRQREKARAKKQANQGQQQDNGSSEEFDSVLQAAAAEAEESARAVVETVDSQAADRENELLYFGSVQYEESDDDDE